MSRATVTELKAQFKFDDAQAQEMFQMLSAFTDEELETGLLVGRTAPKELISDSKSEDFKAEFEKILLAENLKKALSRARANRKITLKEVAAKEGISLPRAQQIENAQTKLELQTLVRHAAALDYSVSITLTPKDGLGETITTKLSYP
jgi:Helix-turn-helix